MRRELIAHGLMAVGVLCALFSLLAVFDQSWEYVYGWLAVALLVQAIETVWVVPPARSGFLSFQAAPKTTVPVTTGPASAIVSFLNCVFVPVVAMLHAGFLDGFAGLGVAAVILLSALYRMAYYAPGGHTPSGETMTHFVGFPAAWSVVGFYLHAFDATPPAAVLIIGLGIVLSLLPIHWPHPLHTERWPRLTHAVVAAWVLASSLTLWHGFLPPAAAVKSVLLAAVAYGAVLTVVTAQAAAKRPEL